jgi:hypothetical protein
MGAEETRERLRLKRKPVIAEDGAEMPVRKMKAKMVVVTFGRGRREACIHPALLLNLFRSVESCALLRAQAHI